MDVADAVVGKGGGGIGRARAEHRHVLVELLDVIARLVLRAAAANDRAPCGQQAELAVAGGLRARRDDRDVRTDEIGPVVDVLRVSLADDEDDGRGVGLRVVRQPLCPAVGDETVLVQRLDIGGKREGHDIGRKPVDHRAGLARGTAV